MSPVVDARKVAAGLLEGSGDRWLHVQAVAARVEALVSVLHPARSTLVVGAWMHDVGYAPSLAKTGFHPLDGARFVSREGFAADVVGLVAYHSGAEFEADERGLLDELRVLRPPKGHLLDILTLADMTTSPTGAVVSVGDRIREILSRYAKGDPVYRAVSRSQRQLRVSSHRAAEALGHPSADEGSLLAG